MSAANRRKAADLGALAMSDYVVRRGQELADELDPRRRREDELARLLDSLVRVADQVRQLALVRRAEGTR